MGQDSSGADERGSAAAKQLTEELRQPLAAACNYIGTARMLSQSSGPQTARDLAEYLDKAEAQVLRAGDIAREIRRALEPNNSA